MELKMIGPCLLICGVLLIALQMLLCTLPSRELKKKGPVATFPLDIAGARETGDVRIGRERMNGDRKSPLQLNINDFNIIENKAY